MRTPRGWNSLGSCCGNQPSFRPSWPPLLLAPANSKHVLFCPRGEHFFLNEERPHIGRCHTEKSGLRAFLGSMAARPTLGALSHVAPSLQGRAIVHDPRAGGGLRSLSPAFLPAPSLGHLSSLRLPTHWQLNDGVAESGDRDAELSVTSVVRTCMSRASRRASGHLRYLVCVHRREPRGEERRVFGVLIGVKESLTELME